MSSSDSFEQLMERLRAADPEAARVLFDRFAQRLTALARVHLDARLRGKVDPEDVLQSAFKSFFRRHAAGEFDPPEGWGGLWSLLTVITLRKCGHTSRHFRALCRDVGREAAVVDEDSALGCQAIAREPTPAEAAVLAETVEQLLAGLEGRSRDIVSLALQGYPPAEIATVLDRPQRTVYRVLERVKKRLQQMQADDGGGR